MGEAFITRRGGGASVDGGVKGAIIGVTYPEGASVSVTNGTKTYTAKDADGNTAFSVEAGTWAVTATQEEESASEEVTVKEGDFVTVELTFMPEGAIFWKGRGQIVPLSIAYKANSEITHDDNGIYLSYSTSSTHEQYISTNDKLDLTPYSTLYIEAEVSSIGLNNTCFGATEKILTINAGNSSYFHAKTLLTVQEESVVYSCDISSVSTEYRISYFGAINGAITKIWLE